MNGSTIIWDNVAWLGGPDAVGERAVSEGVMVQCELDGVLQVDPIHQTDVEYVDGIIDMADTAWRDASMTVDTALCWLPSLSPEYAFCRLNLGGKCTVVCGTLTVVFHDEGLVNWKGTNEYHETLQRLGYLRPIDIEPTVLNLQRICASLEAMQAPVAE